MKMTIIGAGNLGLSLANGIKTNNLTKNKITITRKNSKFSDQEITDFDCQNDNSEAIRNADIVVLAVRPNQLETLAEEIKIKTNQLIISVITGATIKKLEKLFGSDLKIARVMPNVALSTSNSMTCMTFNKKGFVSKNEVEEIFGSLGKTLLIEEKMFPQATVLCGSGVAIVARFIRALMQSGIQSGFNENHSLQMAIQVIKGTAILLENGKHPEVLIDDVTTPGGCTIANLAELEHCGFTSAVLKGTKAGLEKAITL